MSLKLPAWLLILALGATAILSVAGYREFVRLGSGRQLALLQLSLQSHVEAHENYTHAAGPPLSLFANGYLPNIRYRYDRVRCHDFLTFSSRVQLAIDLEATALDYERELGAARPPTPLNFKNSVVVDRELINKLATSKSPDLTLRISGRYFVTYLTIRGCAAFPSDGVISLIVN